MNDRKKEQRLHQERVDAIRRRGLHDRVVSKLHYLMSLEGSGYILKKSETKEVTVLQEMLKEVRTEMIAADQEPGDYSLLIMGGGS